MADQVRMVSNTVFQNDRVTVFQQGGPEAGELGRTVTVGDEFTTDPLHGRELVCLGLAKPLGWSVDETHDQELTPHHQVSVVDLAADRVKRSATGKVSAPLDSPTAVAVQTNRADGGAPVAVATPAAPALVKRG